ncbi:MAG: hypothetical protein L0I24_12895, partial [Pseudonocardia sp.]|nr:hypothetical protein [Pseudonocardia sp.]
MPDRGGVGDGREQQHHRLPPLVGTGRRDLQRDAGLADPARADDGDQAFGPQHPVQGGDLALAPDQPRRRPRRRGRPSRWRGRRAGSTAGDVAFQLAERGGRVEPGLLAEAIAVLAAGPQGVGGAPGNGQRA